MTNLYTVLFFISLGLLLWGLASPKGVGRITRKLLSRQQIAWTFGLLSLVLFVCVGATASPKADIVAIQNASAKTATTTQQTNQTSAAKKSVDVVEVKQVSETKPVAFTTTNQDDNGISKGQLVVTQAGADGVETYTYRVTYTNTLETKRELVSQVVTTPPVAKIIHNGTYVKPVVTTPAPAPTHPTCDGYINSAGNCIASPSANPSGATARCADGAYSYSQTRRGTCSHHHGVAAWL